MRATILFAGLAWASGAAAQEEATEWMLLLQAESSVTFAPTTFATQAECMLVARWIKAELVSKPTCLPAHFSAGSVAEYSKHLDPHSPSKSLISLS